MESIREIVSFSHSGVDHMWYPFAAKLDHNFSVISTETYYQLHDLMGFLRSMFATNNHSPELVRERNLSDSQRYLFGMKKRTECSITFVTERNKYILRRCFVGRYSVEARLQKIGSSIIYHGQNVINMLGKFHKPFLITENSLYNNKSMIFKPDSEFRRSSMLALARNWANMVGIRDSSMDLDGGGNWSCSEEEDTFQSRSRRNNRKPLIAPALRILTHLSQAVMRRRCYGTCPPIMSPFNVEKLNEFEAIAMLDLIKNVSKEEGLQFIVGINTKPQINSMIETISTPSLSVYYI